MKQVMLLEEFEQVEAKDNEEIIAEMRHYQAMIKELQLREKTLKSELTGRLKDAGNIYISENYHAEIKEVKTNRLDSEAVKTYCIKNDLDVAQFQKESVSERLNVKKK